MELLAPDQISEEETKMEAEWQSYSRYWPPPYPPGVRFTPTDEELVKYYLTPKVRRQKLPYDSFVEDDLYQYHPQELAEKYNASMEEEGNWYIFTQRIRKYANGGRPNRSAGLGYWKATSSDQKILDREGKKIGYKKSLVYHEGKQPYGEKTGWVMQEYKIDESQKPIKAKSMVVS
uniref:NAC transcription factor 32-like n=1 Tax=Elaeis guineensis var. tenera TaxID=51953 RepID=A0A6I9RIF7_ELAGV|nr:NAC transcription factor 32-like [Elaeis guineensis]